MKIAVSSLAVAAALLAGCNRTAELPPAAVPASPASAASPVAAAPADTHVAGIAWRHATSDADVAAAFQEATSTTKPVLLYWGAGWCPPCNQLKATLFNRVDFIERTRAVVPVYIDGDTPGAQKLGARFKVVGYPTMILFKPDGSELTRLPGEVDAPQVLNLLTLGLSAQRPMKAVLADARAGRPGLTANDWRLLAFYSWDTDEQQAAPKAELPALLKQLAAAAPAEPPEVANRLLLKAVAVSAEPAPAAAARPASGAAAPKTTPAAAAKTARPTAADPATRERVLRLLADAPAVRAQTDVLSYGATDIVRALSAAGTPERAALLTAFDTALQRLQADTTLSRADRSTALAARVELARIDAAPDAMVTLPEPLLAAAREQAARNDREITDGYERQAVVTADADVLQQAGLSAESDALLQANLAKSHSPYYLMSGLSQNAKQRGDTAGAIAWSEKAFKAAEGPSTRLQWGSSHVRTLVELAPADAARIEAAMQQLIDEAGAQPNAFYERSARSLRRAGTAVVGWSQKSAQAPALKRLQARLDGVCAKLPAGDEQRAACAGVLAPQPASGKTAKAA